jgi:hypothetical protein
MAILRNVAVVLQSILGVIGSERIEDLGRTTGLIRRRRKFSACTLLQMLVLTLLKKPQAKLIDYQATAAELGVFVTQEAIDKRFSKELIAFLREVIERALQPALAITASRAKLLREFTSVRIGDSTTVTLPDEFAQEFPGCGGKSGSGRSAMKIQFFWDLLAGGILSLIIEPGTHSDAKSPLTQQPAPAGSLTIFDLGYFCLKRFRSLSEARAYWISRLQHGTSVYAADGTPLDLLRYLREHGGSGLVDMAILLGAEERLPCRMIAVRVPQEKANRRRQDAIEKAQKHGRAPSRGYLDMQSWNVFVTNCEADEFTWKEVIILYRARWQIELMFKLWKSHNQLAAHKPGASAEQKLAIIYAKLIAIIIQHWVLISASWGDVGRSLTKAAKILQERISSIADALGDDVELAKVLEKTAAVIAAVARIGKRRSQPSLFQLLDDAELLNYEF